MRHFGFYLFLGDFSPSYKHFQTFLKLLEVDVKLTPSRVWICISHMEEPNLCRNMLEKLPGVGGKHSP